jgi:DNA-binding beta-propeller fold protein YncE
MRNTHHFGTILALAALAAACDDASGDPNPHFKSVYAPPTGATTPPVSTPAPTSTVVPMPKLFTDPVRTARAAPIAGGTLLVTNDGKTAVAADPDRDRVFLVDLATRAVRSIPSEPGDELGRVVEGPSGTVFVAARRGGAVLVIDVAAGTLTGRMPVCNAPRGLAYDAAENRLYVACRSGRLAMLDATSGALVSSFELDADLRDVLLLDGSVFVTRFRSAEILKLDASGAVTARQSPPDFGGFPAGVAFRAVPLPNGMFLMAHQIESSSQLGTGFGAYYGGGCSGGGVVQRVLSLVAVDGTVLAPVAPDAATRAVEPNQPFSMSSRFLVNALGPLDLAVSRDGERIAIVASGNSWSIRSDLPTLYVDSFEVSTNAPPASFEQPGCGETQVAHHVAGEPVAVAFDADGKYIAQSREPAALEFEDGTAISLSDESHFDTGFAMFHLNSSGGISCASCHPEGGEDGHTWAFSGIGLRRSQALEGNVGGRTPFHWSGDLPDFHALFSEVMMKRMALPVTPPDTDVLALAAWLDTVPALAPADGLDPALVERGRVLFFDAKVGCSGCHSGPGYADNLKHDVGTGGSFVTPALTGVGLRAPLMHDGCASSLRARFGVCGGTAHGDISALGDGDIDALVAFMRTL